MAKLHLKFTKLDKRAIKAVQEFDRNRHPALDERGIMVDLQNLCNRLAGVYEIRMPEVVLVPLDSFHSQHEGGQFSEVENTIYLTRANVIWTLHQFRHLMQHESQMEFRSYQHMEWDALAWSYSLLYCAIPDKFNEWVLCGAIGMVTPHDLLPAAEHPSEDARAPFAPLDRPSEPELSPDERLIFEGLSEGLLDELASDPEIATLMEQFGEDD